jgi:hypothetical protein
MVIEMHSFQTVDLAIHDETTLEKSAQILHDSVFLADSWSHDEKNKYFHIQLWREIPNIYKHEKCFLFVTRTSFMRAACQLTIRQVTNVRIYPRDKLDCYNLFGIRYNSTLNLIIFQTEGAISLEVSVEGLNCHLVDTGETTWKQHGYSLIGLWKRG